MKKAIFFAIISAYSMFLGSWAFAVIVPPTPSVPEPMIMLLVGAGLIAFSKLRSKFGR